ncbi:UDP-glucose 4-epimerase family protein [Marinobacter sp. F3R08]|uniref:UDP-glucose 4-epimerase family protein n=1 Tax=Marinobacter sp. F3R08 TaxID=2841559 RepID=UPI001C08711B|nr:SDR family oxidoreductase [Marinobacter sp. F3R08]MBU2954455.1 SDR family oxidoreductase [Marinobacter sp. F3R08]
MNEQRSVLVTGASGFIGQNLMRELAADRAFTAIGAVRSGRGGPDERVVGSVDGQTDWSVALAGVDAVVHTAAQVQAMKDPGGALSQALWEVNVAGTLNLARQAARAGVRRFIFMSSIKVNGENTAGDDGFTADDTPAPEEPYGRSKWQAEQELGKLARETGMEVVVIRSPLVYGKGVKGNFASMIGWVERGLPLPFGAVRNRRSMIGVDNLTNLIVTCINHPSAANEVFLASDDEDLSLPEILERLAGAAGKPSRVFSVPVWFLETLASLAGKKALARRLLFSLTVDISKTRERLGWVPPLTLDEGLQRCFSGHGKQTIGHRH